MLTEKQYESARRQIGKKHGFVSGTVDLGTVRVGKDLDGNKIELIFEFSHHSGFVGTEYFALEVSDLRKSLTILT